MVKTAGHIPTIILVFLVLLITVLQRDSHTVIPSLMLPSTAAAARCPLISLIRRWQILADPNPVPATRMIVLQTSQFHLEAPDERQSRRHPLLVLVVILAEEVQQRDLLHENPIVEELPAGDRVDDEANRVRHDDLFRG